jgi:putative CocE/NonD family hydrolase
MPGFAPHLRPSIVTLRRLAGFAMCAVLAGLTSSGFAAQPVPASFGHYQPAADYSETVTTRIYLPMRDGVRIALRIDRPGKNGKPAEGRFPVIWHGNLSIDSESSWNGSAPGLPQMPTLTRYGYVIVQVARRGNGQSFGERRGYHDRNEAQDSYEITQWLASQPWSDGKVGVYGCSNTGDAAMQTLTVRPPALKAAFAGCFSWHKYDAFRRGGILAQWGVGPTRTVAQDMMVKPVDGDDSKSLLRQAVEEHQRSTPLAAMWQGMPYRDSYSPLVGSRFWQEGSSGNYADQIRRSGVALYILGGWHDELRDQGLIAFLNVPGTRIVIGPWKHCKNDDFPLLEEVHRFFDYHLKGIDTGIENDPPIHYFVMNAARGSEWQTARTWPLPAAHDQRLFLTAPGKLAAATAKTGAVTFPVKYDILCPNAGTGPFDTGPFAQPCHVAGMGPGFAGPPLARDTEVTGNPIVSLSIAADAAEANVFAYLEDVAPDGQVTVVTEGRLKASLRATASAPWAMPAGVPWHRSFAEDAAPLTPGTPVRLDFDMMPTAYLFKAGHRIQITVAGADPRESGRDPAKLAKTITILADADHPSSMTIPVVTQ